MVLGKHSRGSHGFAPGFRQAAVDFELSCLLEPPDAQTAPRADAEGDAGGFPGTEFIVQVPFPRMQGKVLEGKTLRPRRLHTFLAQREKFETRLFPGQFRHEPLPDLIGKRQLFVEMQTVKGDPGEGGFFHRRVEVAQQEIRRLSRPQALARVKQAAARETALPMRIAVCIRA